MFLWLMCFSCTDSEEKDETTSLVDYPTEVNSEFDRFLVRYTPTPNPIPLNSNFSIELQIAHPESPTTLLSDLTVEVSAEMPDHGHGMPQLPMVSENSDNSWSASNMLFQMTGYWEILVYITEDNETEVATFQFDCCQ